MAIFEDLNAYILLLSLFLLELYYGKTEKKSPSMDQATYRKYESVGRLLLQDGDGPLLVPELLELRRVGLQNPVGDPRDPRVDGIVGRKQNLLV